LYRDPASGALVVADYKTDAVEGAALEERAQGYAAQGAVYTRAIAAALGLPEPPRFELWFLAAGVVRSVRT
jgi:ATP-dependent exoDNAse (exonuclease V) beta subunit